MNVMVFFGSGPKLMDAIAEDDKCKYWRDAARPQQLYAPIVLPDQPADEAGQKKYIFKNLAIAKVRPGPVSLYVPVPVMIVHRSFA